MPFIVKNCSWCGKAMFRGNMAVHCSVDCALYSRIEIRDENECWPWKGSKLKTGYGRLKFEGRAYKPYRLMCEKRHGSIDGLCAMHTCDNRICCNPNHLVPGSYADNVRDMDNKGRRVNVRGSKHGLSKFTEEQVREIRRKKAAGATGKELAEEYNCVRNHIYCICRNRRWKHV